MWCGPVSPIGIVGRVLRYSAGVNIVLPIDGSPYDNGPGPWCECEW